jgi:hypothetical protein
LMAGVNYWRFQWTLMFIEFANQLSRGVAWVHGRSDGGLDRMIDDEMNEVRSRYGLSEKIET